MSEDASKTLNCLHGKSLESLGLEIGNNLGSEEVRVENKIGCSISSGNGGNKGNNINSSGSSSEDKVVVCSNQCNSNSTGKKLYIKELPTDFLRDNNNLVESDRQARMDMVAQFLKILLKQKVFFFNYI